MSYSIFYRTMFLKLENGTQFIPMCEVGDNNVYNTFNNKRCREWSNLTFNGSKNVLVTEENFLNTINSIYERIKEREGEDNINAINKMFGYYSSMTIAPHSTYKTTYNHFINFFKKGFKQALTFNQFKELNISFFVKVYDKHQFPYENLKEYKPKTEIELIELINSVDQDKQTIHIIFPYFPEKLCDYLNIIKRKQTDKDKTILNTNLGYIKQITNIIPEYTQNVDEAHKFRNFKDANIAAIYLFNKTNTFNEIKNITTITLK